MKIYFRFLVEIAYENNGDGGAAAAHAPEPSMPFHSKIHDT